MTYEKHNFQVCFVSYFAPIQLIHSNFRKEGLCPMKSHMPLLKLDVGKGNYHFTWNIPFYLIIYRKDAFSQIPLKIVNLCTACLVFQNQAHKLSDFTEV